MYYIVETNKSFDQASSDLESVVKKHNYGVLHIHDIGTTLRSKGVTLSEECRVFEICNPMQASKVLSSDMRLNMALPCRISVFTENGETKIGLWELADAPEIGECIRGEASVVERIAVAGHEQLELRHGRGVELAAALVGVARFEGPEAHAAEIQRVVR